MSTEMYENHCKDAFARIEHSLETAKIDRRELKKYLVGNGQEGLIDSVRNHKRYFRCMWGIVVFIGALVATQTAIAWRTHVLEDSNKAHILNVLDRIEKETLGGGD